MDLYLHAGLYKTASSYLQTVCALNADALQKRGIHFPSSEFDADMRAGKISPGNAGTLADDLKQGNLARLIALLQSWKNTASSLSCSSVLVSAEAAIHGLATPAGLQTLQAAANAAGFERVHILAFFRDLVDHALSTYKHRAKSGTIPDFEQWIRDTYETPRVIQGVRASAENRQIDWTFRAFRKDSRHMTQAFFDDWLQIPAPELPSLPRVNESVTLSEVLVMNEVARAYPLVTDYFVNAFKKLPAGEKAADRDLEAWFYQRAFQVLSAHAGLIEELNARMPPAERVVVGDPAKAQQEKAGMPCLSPAQITTLLMETARFRSLSGRFITLRRKVRYTLPTGLAAAIARHLGFQKNV
jgi:hypothetical protein